ncbi:GntR family transcriptional regulator [Roseomonas ludipueritiae]|uniref:GntR family transcriptional regulator n=2 Tax=Pseudoroseomonas ludipueritiae TaxID=198093 RepID=A0ABR7R599_9PROT|nr:GntR family transcriptional regulator [Pseudoroseomonas ludipueritiae]
MSRSTAALADLPQLEHRTLAVTVHAHLRSLLVSGRVAPGERLSLRAVGQALGVSVMPVREAVHRLVADGALEVAPNRVVQVPVMTAPMFRQISEVRIEMEGFAAQCAAERRGPEHLARIEAAEAAFRGEAMRRVPDPGQAVALNQELHFAIYAAAGLPVLEELIDRLWLKVGPVLNLDLRANPERLASGGAVGFHARAARAVRMGDGAAARAAIAEDIGNARDFILARGGLPPE